VAVNLIFPDIPAALAVASMLAAVPGSYIRAPISTTFIAAIAVGLEPEGVAPVIVAVVTAYLLVAADQHTIAAIRPTDTPR
jgi:pyruvate/2-oxoglutarate/acetoin dehydrogenase E1 component